MIIMRFHCDSCGGKWDVYAHMKEYDQSRTCPHCGQRIDADTWQKSILPAYKAVKAANEVIYHDHIEFHSGVFAVDFIADTVFENAKR